VYQSNLHTQLSFTASFDLWGSRRPGRLQTAENAAERNRRHVARRQVNINRQHGAYEISCRVSPLIIDACGFITPATSSARPTHIQLTPDGRPFVHTSRGLRTASLRPHVSPRTSSSCRRPATGAYISLSYAHDGQVGASLEVEQRVAIMAISITAVRIWSIVEHCWWGVLVALAALSGDRGGCMQLDGVSRVVCFEHL
jgi:hypothetical protein